MLVPRIVLVRIRFIPSVQVEVKLFMAVLNGYMIMGIAVFAVERPCDFFGRVYHNPSRLQLFYKRGGILSDVQKILYDFIDFDGVRRCANQCDLKESIVHID